MLSHNQHQLVVEYHVIEHLVDREVARDPTSRIPFVNAGLGTRTIGCSYAVRLLNVNLDRYDFPSDFH